MIIRVVAHSGYKADERPKAILIGEKELEVIEVADRWYGEDYEYFKLRAGDGCTYIIRLDRERDEWELVMMEQGRP